MEVLTDPLAVLPVECRAKEWFDYDELDLDEDPDDDEEEELDEEEDEDEGFEEEETGEEEEISEEGNWEGGDSLYS